jgi:hypothetical protein
MRLAAYKLFVLLSIFAACLGLYPATSHDNAEKLETHSGGGSAPPRAGQAGVPASLSLAGSKPQPDSAIRREDLEDGDDHLIPQKRPRHQPA